MSYSREEQETSILCDGNPRSPWKIYSSVPKHMRRLTLLAEAWGAEISYPHEGGMIVELPEKAVGLRKPVTRTMTEEQKAAASARLKKMRAKAKANRKNTK